MQYIELDGSFSLFKTYPALEITWHKTQEETYCHHARLVFESPDISTPIQVSITTTKITSPSSKQPKISHSTINRYLPCKSENGLVYVNLDSTELVEAIELCEYTKDSEGNNNNLVSYPSEIKFRYSSHEESYLLKAGLPPLLICQDLLRPAEFGNKITVHINLKSTL